MKKAKIIVLSGQSNAVGIGHIKCLSRSFTDEKIREYVKGYENVRINYSSHDKRSDGFTATAANGTELHKQTVGPELGMAEYLSESFPDEEYFIVKFAVGSASLMHDFLSPSSGGYYGFKGFKNEYRGLINAFLVGEPVKAGWCYNGLVELLYDSIASLEEKEYSPEIIGFCWMQGESDATCAEHVNNYKTYFDNFIKDLKAEFSRYMSGCVFADAGISEVWSCYEEMNAFKKEYAEKNSGFVFVDTVAKGLTTRYEPVEAPDIAHYDCESVIRLGKLFAETVTGKA